MRTVMRHYFEQSLKGVLNSTISFFHQSKTGRILQRLGNDTYIIYYLSIFRTAKYNLAKILPIVNGRVTSQITEALNGNLLIETFGVKESFNANLAKSMNKFGSLTLCDGLARRWATLRFSILHLLLIAAVAIYGVVTESRGANKAGMVGISLLTLTPLCYSFLLLITELTAFENQVGENNLTLAQLD
jgi:ABC-type transport system involved in cytochrome bd biosynthesis fused ATPase/permease subunit